jgi:hypothetical protein
LAFMESSVSQDPLAKHHGLRKGVRRIFGGRA